MPASLPDRPPFRLRARILTPLAAGGTRYEPDGMLSVDAAGRIASIGPFEDTGNGAHDAVAGPVIDLRPWLLLPGLI
ncbi:MAG TPA: hypothetical protein VID95_11095, partial [Candidatus Limnocylindrales bacterium]